MIDRNQPLEIQVEKQARIIDALILRANRAHDFGDSAYALFQSAVSLQDEVWEKSKDLELALDTLGKASVELETAEFARDQMQRNLADVLDMMEGGFALFTADKLQICNDIFQTLIPDIAARIVPGLTLEAYFELLNGSALATLNHDLATPPGAREQTQKLSPGASFVLALPHDRWFQVISRRTSSNSTALLQTEITGIVRKNRLEKDRLIDEQTHFLQAAFDNMTQGVCTFSAEGTLLIQNAAFGGLLGLPYPLRRKGTAFAQILEHVTRNRLLQVTGLRRDIEEMILRMRRDGMLQDRIRQIDGRVLDLHFSMLPDGGFIVNIMDITAETQTTESLEKRVQERTAELTQANLRLRQQYEAQARVEDELRIAKEEAEAAVSSKTRFLAAASHDLLQPINAAKLLISSLVEGSRGSGMLETVERLDRAFNSIESLLHALLDISRLESTGTEIALSEFEIDQILHHVSEDCAPLAAEKSLRLSVVPSGLRVKSDQHYLLRCVQNLVVNAIEYTPKGRVLVGCRRRGGKAVLEVWDSGIGISRKDQKVIFKEFSRINTSATGPGMGLGLSIVERACRHLGHSISVRSKPGVGSVFSLELPIAQSGSAAQGVRSRMPSTPQFDMDLIIVVVENDPDVLFATTQKLESWGASVLGAHGTQEAIQLVREIGMPPDLILADYQLDDTDDGIKAITALRDLVKSETPAIMITADRSEWLLQAGQNHNFSVLTKPVHLSRLRPLIDWKTRPAGPQGQQTQT
ncbi:hybrid sensor histidine kinase/response regulator [Roseovarius sp. M141]|nr:hybrid sensor histidine kinase/response regulator [Roseovarius sp. M141]MCQ0093093.1 hybrid sensor histidine kinase/response regulator [Roseovarius sp. M141]